MADNGKDGDKSTSFVVLGDDPFAIHYSDNPTVVFVSPPLNRDNYGSWLRTITMALRAKNKIGFVDGSIQQPRQDKVTEVSQWERCNDLVGSWILNSVFDEIRSIILYADTARAIWTDLSKPFSQSNAPKIYQLKQSISSLKQDDLSILDYFTKLKSLWDELNSLYAFQPFTCESGKIFSECLQQDRVMEFLQGLHDRFAAIRSQILLIEPFSSAAKMRDGHSKKRCFKIIGYPPKRSDFSSFSSKSGNKVAPSVITQEQYDKLLAMLSSSNINPSFYLAVHDNGNFDFSSHPSPPVPNGHVDTLNNSAPGNLDVVDDDPLPITEPALAHAPVPLRRRQPPYLADYLYSSATHGASSLPSDSSLKGTP
ncbi:hypothetical protein F0562_030619 [Nyssa sinensis]|uniref:Retrotransposon Copia-like N-terminal domain-containing protein n=1 Tax=Nyssa sinensis TaxID=561372 RepID=A0A5J5B0B4_9ASTE|nr:hypothetical protein F0562_030619 [Nyssa sinensis]